MRTSDTDGLAIGKSWQRHIAKFRQIFTLLTGYEIMLEESRRDIKPINPTPKTGRTV